MTILWCESFDYYGSDRDLLLQGAWASNSLAITTISSHTLNTNSRTGTYAIRKPAAGSDTTLWRGVGSERTTVGVGFALFYSILPDVANTAVMVDFRDTFGDVNLTIHCQTTGVIEVIRGYVSGGTSLGQTTAPHIVANGYQHVEVIATMATDSTGSVEVRVNQQSVLSLTNVQTAVTNAECSILGFPGNKNNVAPSSSSSTHVTYYDDIVAHDGSSFLGDVRVYTLFPDGDTATADWTATVGNPYEDIHQTAPDDDTSYIYAPGNVSPSSYQSDFDLDELPVSFGTIVGVVPFARSRKTEAGVADIELSVKSGSSYSAPSTQWPVSMSYSYDFEVVELDPNTGSAFTISSVNASQISIERVG